jgi:hypothetical protein
MSRAIPVLPLCALLVTSCFLSLPIPLFSLVTNNLLVHVATVYVFSDRLCNSHVVATRMFVLRNFVLCCIICCVLRCSCCVLWCGSLCGGAVLCYGAVCCIIWCSCLCVVVQFCVTVRFVVLSDAIVCVLWCGLLYAVLQLNTVCTFQGRWCKFVINSNKLYFI